MKQAATSITSPGKASLIPARSGPGLNVAPWQARQPRMIANAVAEACRVAPHISHLAEHLVPWMPCRPLASQTIRAVTIDRYSQPMPLDVAITCPWLALDDENHANVILVDVDHSDADEMAERVGQQYDLPRPAVVQDPWSGRAHVIARLASPVCTNKDARQKPQFLLRLAGRLLATMMRGTLLPSRSLAKNPWGLSSALIGAPLRRSPSPSIPGLYEAHVASGSPLMWNTLPGDLHAYELHEIIAALADDFGEEVAAASTRAHFRRHGQEPDSRGRNCMLFDLVRWWAYHHQERDGGAIQAEADRTNATFSDPLPTSEVRATARSITRFMVMRYRPRTGSADGRGRDHTAGTGLTPVERRALSGRTTATQRAAGTDRAINTAVAALRAEGQTLTQAAIAAKAGVSVRSVRSRWKRQDGALSGSQQQQSHVALFDRSSREV